MIPTYNERDNVLSVLARLELALAGVAWEAVFVDDHSPDGTAGLVRGLARQNPRVRVLERVGRRGLSSACIEGMMAGAAPALAVMDADGQHDERVLPAMLALLGTGDLDLVVASRRAAGGSMGEFAAERVALSELGARLSRMVCQAEITDPMSGFFVVEAEFFRRAVPRLTGSGFKILVDLLASSKVPPRVAEVPYRFGSRLAGESKLDTSVELEYLFLLTDKLIGRFLPTRFVLFVLVGALGVVVHLSVLAALYLSHASSFPVAQGVATAVAMTVNFAVNNVVTFRDRRLRGLRLLGGLLKFYAACSLGAAINLAFATLLTRHAVPWWLAGISGTAISSVWNYGVNTVLTWRSSRG